MTDPRMTPTNDAPVTVEQCDRDFAAQWIVIAPQNARLIRNGEWDHHEGVQAAARHRLAALASAPAGDEPIPSPAWFECYHDHVFGDRICAEHARLGVTAAVKRDALGDLPSRIMGWVGKARSRGGDRIELNFETVELLVRLALRGQAALARPRAAVGEQSRSRRLTEDEARELVGFEPDTILTCLREWGYVEDAALQSPPAKVEGA